MEPGNRQGDYADRGPMQQMIEETAQFLGGNPQRGEDIDDDSVFDAGAGSNRQDGMQDAQVDEDTGSPTG